MDDQVNTKPKKRAKFTVVFTFVIFFAVFGIYFYVFTNNNNPINEYSKDLKFSVYYPKSNKYKYVNDSAYISGGILNYRVLDGGNEISITQQESTLKNKSIRIEGYNNVATPIGGMYVGQLKDKTNAVITTSTTIISINSIGSSTQEDLQALSMTLKKIN